MQRGERRGAQREPTLMTLPRFDQFFIAIHDVVQDRDFFARSIESSSVSSNGVVDLR